MYRCFMLILVSILATACTPNFERAETSSVKPTLTATAPACQPSVIQESPNSFPEIQATMKSEGEAWALLFFDEAHANEDLKIVWRVTVTGPGTEIQAQAYNQEGKVVQPTWGPEFHSESTWERPGLEWGTGFNFPEPGCWTLTIKAGATQGEISLDVLK